MRRNLKLLVSVVVVAALGGGLRAQDPHSGAKHPVYLDQGWTADERELFYYTPQGSELIPFQWFLHLETKEGHSRFRENRNLDKLRYVTQSSASKLNPEGLPVGFVEDVDVDPTQTSSKLAYLTRKFAKKSNPDEKKTWLGLTCAACHTNRIEFGDKTIQIDGGPAMADLQTFLVELAAALESTHKDAAKMQRFARALKVENNAAFKDEVVTHSEALNALVKRNASQTKYGFARLDAFGAILNAVCVMGLDIPTNQVEANAPVSYPFLWETPRMDWVQWNSSSNIPLARNVGEVLGVFGFFTLKNNDNKQHQFDSTVKLRALMRLEETLNKLKAPLWPEKLLGKLDQAKVEQGRILYAKNCAACHQVRKADGTFEMVQMGTEMRIKTVSVPVQTIKTDPQMILNLGRTADPGVLKELLPPALANCAKVSRAALLSLTVTEVTKNRALIEHVPLMPNPASAIPPPFGGAGYKARALEGIWATAPFMHNGSIPNLYEVLLPAAQRSKSFFVGSRKFDSKKIGFQTEASQDAFEFKVADDKGFIAGNSNAGHEGHRFTELLEGGKWREFKDEERWALVEYMKALGLPGTGLGAEPIQGDADSPDHTTTDTEQIPNVEAAQINHIVDLTIQQLKNRYPAPSQALRGVHAKDHGCVKAAFDVATDLAPEYRVGVFAEPGKHYESMIRFSNASTLVLPDNGTDMAGKTVFGSRGMAVKLLGVKGTPLLASEEPLTQDFLMVNHPVFAFANVEDYEVLSGVLADVANKESPVPFFGIQQKKGGLAAARALRSGGIVFRIQAPNVASGAFQPQPASPVDCRYFSGAPFLFGDGFVMKFSARQVDPPANPAPNVSDPNYLRTGLIERLKPGATAKPVVFKFQVQRRSVKGLQIASDIEDACSEWPECTFPFVDVATITIPPQEFDSAESRAACEAMVFTPWHGVKELRPLGGINRMRKAVYQASSQFRLTPRKAP